MKITIDTQHDSYEDIKKVLHILTEILERKENGAMATSGNAADTTNMMNMFDAPASAQQVPDTAPDFGSFLSLTKQDSARKERPRVEWY